MPSTARFLVDDSGDVVYGRENIIAKSIVDADVINVNTWRIETRSSGSYLHNRVVNVVKDRRESKWGRVADARPLSTSREGADQRRVSTRSRPRRIENRRFAACASVHPDRLRKFD